MKTGRRATWRWRRSPPSGRRARMKSAPASSFPARLIIAKVRQGRAKTERPTLPLPEASAFYGGLRSPKLFRRSRQRRRKCDATESVNAAQVVFRPRLINDALVARGVIETVRVRDDSDVGQAVEEDERAELELFVFARRRKAGPVSACAAAREVNADLLECAPDETGTIEHVRPRGAPHVM